jgi:Xaa-Pro aminopeptidase
MPAILDERASAKVIDQLLEERFETVLPELMRKHKVDMWIIISREYNEDPVMRTMLPATWLSARRRTILVMFDQGPEKGIERLAIARYDVGRLFKGAWNQAIQPDQWKALVRLINERDPKNIALNFSTNYAHVDGLTYTEHKEFLAELPKKYQDRIVSAENLGVAWLETRTDNEMVIYQHICRIAHVIIQEGFSEKAITPGVTTTEDLVWWFRNRAKELGMEQWFHPSVAVQRADPESFDHLRTFSSRPEEQIIYPGDLLHVDFGVKYLRLNTDTQQHAYVLKPGETEPPRVLQDAFKKGNRLQDILTAEFKAGRTGNEILAAARAQAEKEGLVPSIYTHPIGYYGHASGPTIGMWDNQGNTIGAGDYPLNHRTAYSIELNVSVEIPEWGKTIRIMLEEDGYFDEKGEFRYIDGRQTELYTVPRVLPNNSQKAKY